jgi:hypothetical protein
MQGFTCSHISAQCFQTHTEPCITCGTHRMEMCEP